MIEHYTRAALIAGHWVGGAMLFAGTWLITQANLDAVDRYVGGSIIVIAGAFIIRWVLKTSERVEATWTKAVGVAEHRAEVAEERCEKMRKAIDELTLKYEQERQLRISLEGMGLIDRRRKPDAEPDTV